MDLGWHKARIASRDVLIFREFPKFLFRRFEGGPRAARRVEIPPIDRRRRGVWPGNLRRECGLPGATEKFGELGNPGFQWYRILQ
jgi:hypothetical protein